MSTQAEDCIRIWRESPVQMVRDIFNVEPDEWQRDALEIFPLSPRLAMKACTGPGKTCVLAWASWNFLLTRPHPYIACTSINKDNLKAGLWKEMAVWYAKAPLLQRNFAITTSTIYNRESPDTWKMEARTWAKDADAEAIGNALAGIHGEYVMWVLDETGDYPEAILPTCEAIFSGNPIEAHIVQAGNPTKRGGPLYHAWQNRNRTWRMIEITADPDDPHRTPRVSLEHAMNMITTYGRDNPWVRVKIFGQFPDSDFNALIGPDEVDAAMSRMYREDEIRTHARILGVDVARYGDDKSVIARRQGLQMWPFLDRRSINSVAGASWVNRTWDEFSADAGFVDNTGGYGAGWIDQLLVLKKSPIGIGFADSAHKKDRYFNKRAEMAFDFVAWIKRGGALPPSPELKAALVQTTYTFKGDRFLLEPKEDVKAKLGYSPDDFDAAILTHAEPVSPSTRQATGRSQHTFEHDPFANVSLTSAVSSSYDPFK